MKVPQQSFEKKTKTAGHVHMLETSQFVENKTQCGTAVCMSDHPCAPVARFGRLLSIVPAMPKLSKCILTFKRIFSSTSHVQAMFWSKRELDASKARRETSALKPATKYEGVMCWRKRAQDAARKELEEQLLPPACQPETAHSAISFQVVDFSCSSSISEELWTGRNG